MKRIILGLLLILVQNGFAKTDAEFDKEISNATVEVNRLILLCNKEARNHQYNGHPEVCIKAFDILQKEYPNEKVNIRTMANSAGFLYHNSKKNYIKAYEYYMKAAKLGHIYAQDNLDILCRQHAWACKQ